MEACVPFQIYIHIPFCVRKCNYCDFLSFPAEKEIQEQYFDSLRQEILSFEDTEGREVVSVFFGGGTPSLPDPALIISTLDLIRSGFRIFPSRKSAETLYRSARPLITPISMVWLSPFSSRLIVETDVPSLSATSC